MSVTTICLLTEDQLMVALRPDHRQLPLIQFVESDDLFLHDQVDAIWFDVINALDYHAFQVTAAHYYEQLFTFNQQQKQRRNERREDRPPANPETHGQATQRTLLERTTLDDQAPVLHAQSQPVTPLTYIAPHEVAPGVTPVRIYGRPPKCFFAMVYAFLGTTLARQPAEPEFVHQRLCENPAFARTCGFTIPRPGKPERQSDIPSLRKLQQFDQIMTETGLWEELALDRVATNLREGRIQVEGTLVHDTTHYRAFSSMQVIELPEAAAQPSAPADKVIGVKVDGTPVVVGRAEVIKVPVDQIGEQTVTKVPEPVVIETTATETNLTTATSKTLKTPEKTAAVKPNSKPA
jgi:hypothetical protein